MKKLLSKTVFTLFSQYVRGQVQGHSSVSGAEGRGVYVRIQIYHVGLSECAAFQYNVMCFTNSTATRPFLRSTSAPPRWT